MCLGSDSWSMTVRSCHGQPRCISALTAGYTEVQEAAAVRPDAIQALMVALRRWLTTWTGPVATRADVH